MSDFEGQRQAWLLPGGQAHAGFHERLETVCFHAEQLEIVLQEKAAAAKFVWVHADNEKDHTFHKKIGEAGAWVEFDHIGPAQQAIDWHLGCVRFMEQHKLLGRTLISEDAAITSPASPTAAASKTTRMCIRSLLRN